MTPGYDARLREFPNPVTGLFGSKHRPMTLHSMVRALPGCPSSGILVGVEHMRGYLKILAGFGLGFLVAFILLTQGFEFYRRSRGTGNAGGAEAGPERLIAADNLSLAQFQDSLEAAAGSAEKSVVTINTKSYQEVYDLFLNVQKVPQQGLGSGVIFDKRGYVLTNNHVVSGAEEILVSLLDGRNVPGKVVGRDPETDVAVVQIQADKLPVIPLGNSDQLKKAQMVLAIGNPFGLESTVTFGVVSALGRSIRPDEGTEEIQNLVQIDAAINRGNSGGALVDLSGRLVGINTAIIPPTEGHGIGFAIPIKQAIETADQLIAHGKVTRPWLGVMIQDQPLSSDESKAHGLPARIAIVNDLYRDSPADRGGLIPRDVIVTADGKTVTGAEDLKKTIRSHKIGDRISLKVLRFYPHRRANETLTFNVTLGDKPVDDSGI